MPTRLQIRCINKQERYNPHERIINVGGFNNDGTRFKITQPKAIELIESRQFQFYVNVNSREVDVIVSTSAAGNKYIKTTSDGDSPNNLLNLPECP